MLVITAPAKTQDFKTEWSSKYSTQSLFLKETNQIVETLKKYPVSKLAKLYHSSNEIAELNFERINKWELKHTNKNSKPAILAYAGDIFKQMTPKTYTESEQEYAQKHVRIISGLYGIVKAYDLIQPYRLEMKAKLKVGKSKDLYTFWKPVLTKALQDEVKNNDDEYFVNAASEESFKSIDLEALGAKIITTEFRENRNGKLVNVSIFSKKARGMIIEYMVKNNVKTPKDLEGFNLHGYKFVKWEGNSIFYMR